MVDYKDVSDIARKSIKLHRKKSNIWPMVCFTHNASERTTWIDISSKLKAQYPKQHFKFFFGFQATDN